MTATLSTVTAVTTTADTTKTDAGSHLVRATALATAAAAVATEIFVALVHAAGVDVAIQGKTLGVGGCAISVLMCMVAGAAVIYGVRRWAAHPARAWVRTTVVLTALSFVPDLTVPSTSAGTRLTLMTAHVLAAAIIIPAVARRLPSSR
jgi:uncharacterized membrane protein YidH (DUF202 family)